MLSLAFFVGLPFIEDDYAAAAARAAKENKPIVIDFWAPWCHACLSMKQYVFTDPKMAEIATSAVYVAIDTEKEKNAVVVQRFPAQGLPTFLIVDPQDKHVVARLLGSATAAEFVEFVKQANPKTLSEADELATQGKHKEAGAKYALALTEAKGGALGRAAMGLAGSQEAEKDFAGCEKTAAKYAPLLKDTYYGPSLYMQQAACLMEQDKSADTLVGPLTAAAQSTRLNVDDRSDVYALLAEVAEAKKDDKEVKRLREARKAMLEAAARQAPSPEAARVFDAHRTDVYLALNQPELAIAMLKASETQAPQDYNPPARLARAYLHKGELDNAKAAIGRAKKLVYGPRAAVVQLLEADILVKAGDKPGAKAAYLAAKSTLEKQPPTAGRKMRLADIEKKLATL